MDPSKAAGKGAILIAALSGRALSEGAARAGYITLVADLFGDADMRRSAFASRKVSGSLDIGFDAQNLWESLDELSLLAPEKPIGLVYGAGFEQNVALLSSLSRRWRILGTSPEIVQAVKDPKALKFALDQASIPLPEMAFEPPNCGSWLTKSIGGAGGSHIRRITEGDKLSADGGPVYFQEEVAGKPVSALFLGAAGKAFLVGFSEQWTKGTEDKPFRYGGACHLVSPDPALLFMLDEILERITPLFQRFPMLGLFSIDFLTNGTQWWLIEVNPRPGATLDIFDIDGANLFEHHIDAINGKLPVKPITYAKTAAAEVLYADKIAFEAKTHDFPDWIKDQPAPGTVIELGEPICTILAIADKASDARKLCKERICYAQTFLSQEKNDREGRHDFGRHRPYSL